MGTERVAAPEHRLRAPARAGGPWAALAWAYAAALAVWVVAARPAPGDPLLALLRLPVFAGPALAAFAGAGRRTGRDRLAWQQVGLAWSLSTAAGLIWVAARGAATPLTAFADDVLYNAYYPFMVAALLLLARLPAGPGPRLHMALDAVVVVVATLAVAWYFLLRHDAPDAVSLDTRDLLTNVLGETLVLLCAAVALHRPGRDGAEPGLRLLALGAFAATLADLTSAGARLAPSPALAAASEVAMAISAALVVGAALQPGRVRPVLWQATDLLVRMFSHLPYLSMLAVGGLLLRELALAGPGGPSGPHLPVLAVALVLLSGLALLRAVAAQRDAEVAAAARAVQEERARQGRRLEVMGELAAAVSHDFANLLTALGGSASDLQERLPGTPEVEEIQQLVQRGTELCRGLLRFSRRTTPQEAADLRQVAEAVVPLLRRLLPAGHTLAVVGEVGVARAVADPGQLEVAIVNLVVNARDAMPGGGTVEIAVDAPELPEPARLGPPRPRRWARLSVRDTGQGMDAATLARCTEPFFTTKPPERGTGLGLATVNGVALAAGGRLEIDSAPGKGTRISLLLPLAAAGGEAGTEPAAATLRVTPS